MQQKLVDKAEIEYRFRKSIDSYDENAYVQKIIVVHLMKLWETYCPRTAKQVFEIGCGTGLLTEQIQKKCKYSDLFINDLVAEMCNKTAIRCKLLPAHCIAGDIEQIKLDKNFDLIFSASTFQWLAHPWETFTHLADHLCPGGYLIFNTFGQDNFKELKQLTGDGLIYHSINEMSRLLDLNFEILYVEEDHHIVEFQDPIEVLKHVKKTGVNATSSSSNWTRGRLNEFARAYTANYLTHDRYPLTYHPQYWVCRKK